MGIFGIDAKIVHKRSSVAGQVPTVAPSDDHTDGTWSETDIYSGEYFFNEVDEKLFTRIGAVIKEINLDISGVSNDYVVYSIGGEWVFNGNTWRGLGDGYNLAETAHSDIYVNRVYPFLTNANTDFGIGGTPYNGLRRFGHVIMFDSEIISIDGHMINTSASNQEFAFAVIVMRLNTTSLTMEAVNTTLAKATIAINKVGRMNYVLSAPISVLAGDHLVYATACEINQTTTLRTKGSFSVLTKKL